MVKVIIHNPLESVTPARPYCRKHRGLTFIDGEVKEWYEKCTCGEDK